MPHAYWFGEDQARYIVTVPAAEAGLVLAKMKGAGVPCARIGTTGGDAIAVAGEAAVSVDALKAGVRALVAGLYERQGVVARFPMDCAGWREATSQRCRDCARAHHAMVRCFAALRNDG